MKDKIIAYGKEYIDNFKQNPLSATAVLTMQIIFILGWGTFYMFLCERYIKYIIPGRTYTKSAIYPEAFSLTVIAFVFLFFICKIFTSNYYFLFNFFFLFFIIYSKYNLLYWNIYTFKYFTTNICRKDIIFI